MGNIDWGNLSFGYIPTDYNIRCSYKEGAWGDLEVSDSQHFQIPIAATCLHYGQEAFEGLKAFRGRDGKVRIFRMDENAKRLQSSCRGVLMPELPVDVFCEAIKKVVKLNERFVPPFDSGASLYIRPIIFGTGIEIGVKPAKEYMFTVFVMPVGPYFKTGFKPTNLLITREFDRAAPQGTGTIKVGGNYAASLRSGVKAHENGYSAVLYLDSKEKKYVDECGPANFFGIKNNTYITPLSGSVLPSITNNSLMTLAKELGMTVEQRKVPVEELATFEEAGACGTAAVISPVGRIDDEDNNLSYVYSSDGEPGAVCLTLYNKLRAIQYGEEADNYGWITLLEE